MFLEPPSIPYDPNAECLVCDTNDDADADDATGNPVLLYSIVLLLSLSSCCTFSGGILKSEGGEGVKEDSWLLLIDDSP